ncbi:MAG: hypothetical protein UR42_C0007G0018, partial [Candidatus Roizmanbacteria bacterium GW2011_GWA2_33_33]
MKTLYTIFIFFLFFFLSAFSVRAEIIAGASAPLVYNSFIKNEEIEKLRQIKIKNTIESVLNRYG